MVGRAREGPPPDQPRRRKMWQGARRVKECVGGRLAGLGRDGKIKGWDSFPQ